MERAPGYPFGADIYFNKNDVSLSVSNKSPASTKPYLSFDVALSILVLLNFLPDSILEAKKSLNNFFLVVIYLIKIK